MRRKTSELSLPKILTISVLLNVIQVTLLVTLIIYEKTTVIQGKIVPFIYIIGGAVVLNSILLGSSLYSIIFNKSEKGVIEVIRNLEDLNRKLREQRHDYLNHIQIIYGLMELEEYEEARKYMEPVYKDIIKVSKALRTCEPAVNALLQAKLQMAESKDILVELEVKTELKKLSIEPWELCRILGNLIDNSIYALETIGQDRKLFLDIGEDIDNHRFSIINNGPKISQENLDKIFEEGYTTKVEQGHGMGLFIVKSLVKKAGGTIEVNSDNNKTAFFIVIPKVKNTMDN